MRTPRTLSPPDGKFINRPTCIRPSAPRSRNHPVEGAGAGIFDEQPEIIWQLGEMTAFGPTCPLFLPMEFMRLSNDGTHANHLAKPLTNHTLTASDLPLCMCNVERQHVTERVDGQIELGSRSTQS
jgi:hypothetical protein